MNREDKEAIAALSERERTELLDELLVYVNFIQSLHPFTASGRPTSAAETCEPIGAHWN